jgi:hypothetical protein
MSASVDRSGLQVEIARPGEGPSRRGFLGALLGAVAGAALDPERALWIPGKKTISIPAQYYVVKIHSYNVERFLKFLNMSLELDPMGHLQGHGRFINPNLGLYARPLLVGREQSEGPADSTEANA